MELRSPSQATVHHLLSSRQSRGADGGGRSASRTGPRRPGLARLLRVTPSLLQLQASVVTVHLSVRSAIEILRTGARRLFDVMRQEQANVYSRLKNKKTPKVGGDDRIGSLPDKVLQHVLSFLSAREVVQTYVLARRWCHLWRRSMPAPRITSGDGWRMLKQQEIENLNRFVNNLLLLHNRNVPLDL